MTHLVPSLETCLSLNEAGYPMNTELSWLKSWFRRPRVIETRRLSVGQWCKSVPAPTLGEMLREMPTAFLLGHNAKGYWWCGVVGKVCKSEFSPEEAAAEMWLRKEGK